MNKTSKVTKRAATDRQALRKRVKQFYLRFNKADWQGCFALIDPQLTQHGKVNAETYSDIMQAFKDSYGSVNPWHTRLSLHLKVSPKQRDKRPFAYVYLIWQDEAHGFHMFRERWVKEQGQWFTRLVGLVPNKQETEAA
jgi:hypothetical protein